MAICDECGKHASLFTDSGGALCEHHARVVYKVWVCIERFDPTTGEHLELDAPGSSAAEFHDYDAAAGLVDKLNDHATALTY